jgi:uncharacterized protein
LLFDRISIWQASARFGRSIPKPSLAERLHFLSSARRHKADIEPLLAADQQSLLGRTLRQQSALYNMARSPYICSSWHPAERIDHFVAHIALAEQMGGLFGFDVSQEIRLLDLSMIGEGYHLLLDKPIWFHREGIATLNLFFNEVRLFSLAFAIAREPKGMVAIIGGIQGRQLPNILDQYRTMTKLAHGMRPRDLLIELFRTICRDQNIVEIRAISDSHRHHRSTFFGRETARMLPLDYDALWLDRGAEPIDAAFFRLSTARQARDQANIPARKRALYRHRYDMLDQLEASMRKALTNPRTTTLSVSI